MRKRRPFEPGSWDSLTLAQKIGACIILSYFVVAFLFLTASIWLLASW